MTSPPQWIYYFRVPCLEDRQLLDLYLSYVGFRFLDCTGGQASYLPGRVKDPRAWNERHRMDSPTWRQEMVHTENDFSQFEVIVRLMAIMHDIDILELKQCDDPGLGLF